MTTYHRIGCKCGRCHLHASDTCWFCRSGSPIRKERAPRTPKERNSRNVREAAAFALKAKIAKGLINEPS
jgi:hypothetical protein